MVVWDFFHQQYHSPWNWVKVDSPKIAFSTPFGGRHVLLLPILQGQKWLVSVSILAKITLLALLQVFPPSPLLVFQPSPDDGSWWETKNRPTKSSNFKIYLVLLMDKLLPSPRIFFIIPIIYEGWKTIPGGLPGTPSVLIFVRQLCP